MPELKNKMTCSVCSMEIKAESGFKTDYKGQSYSFCGENCKKKFMRNPDKYIGKEHAVKAA